VKGLGLSEPPEPYAVIDMRDLVQAICQGTSVLENLEFSENAPPAFLLDSRRLENPAPKTPGLFDNRWMVFPQDFPSASLLKDRGIDAVLLVQSGREQPSDDLAHVLLRYQEAGLKIYSKDPANTDPCASITVRRPSGFRTVWYRAMAMLGLRRNSAGGFGSFVPVAGSRG
jgi:hypothetical protein